MLHSKRRTRAAMLCAGVLALALVPTTANAANIGAGEAHGTVTATPGKGVPPLNSPCQATEFTFDGQSESATFTTNLVGFVGPVQFKGKASATCEATSAGFGAMELTEVKGVGLLSPANTLNCADPATGTKLTGGYTRNGAVVTSVLGGTCTINGSPAPIQLFFRGVLAPNATPQGQGVSAPITSATFAGAYVISPA